MKNEKCASEVIESIIDKNYDITKIRAELKKTVDDALLTWDERVKQEVDLICGGKK